MSNNAKPQAEGLAKRENVAGSRRIRPSASPLPLCGAALAGLMALPLPSPSWAGCDPDPPSSGDTVTCDGNPNGFSTSRLDALTVNVVSGTNFNGPFSISNSGILDITTAANMNSVTLTNNDVIRFENLGNMNQGLVISGDGDYTVINRSSAHINQSFTITGNSDNTILNEGKLNNGITINGDGTTRITNVTGAFINQGIFINGASITAVDNSGTIQSSTLLGTGNDGIVNRDTGTMNGTIDEGAGDDAFAMLGGRVNADIQQNTGRDYFALRGGEVTGFIRSGAGDDEMAWDGGLIGGVDMGDGTDRARFYDLTDTQLKQIQIDGGLGSGDRLFWFGTQGTGPNRLKQWELISLQKGSTLTMNENLVLGDSGSKTGTLEIDNTSTLLAGDRQSTISASDSGSRASVRNAGGIDLTNGSQSTNDSLTIRGNYEGFSGSLFLQTLLGTDGSPSDTLVIDGGVATGTTGIDVTNVNGTGEETKLNGILVVQAVNNGTTDPKSFSLSHRVSAGAFEYFLFRGGKDGGTDDNWYLRNNFRLIDLPYMDPGFKLDPLKPGIHLPDGIFNPKDLDDPDNPVNPDNPGIGDLDGDGDDDLITTGKPGDPNDPDVKDPLHLTDYVQLYRPEVPILNVVPHVSRVLLRETLGTFHERMGEQNWMSGADAGHAAWGRIFGLNGSYDIGGPLNSDFDGNLWGMQAGTPVYTTEHGNGQQDTLGVFFGYSHASGSIEGDLLGRLRFNVGDLNVNAYSLGGYWTHTWDSGTYVDAVLMQSWLDVGTSSIGGYSTDIDGWATTASLEAGAPFQINDHWQIEPQAQILWQHLDFDNTDDPGGSIRYDTGESVIGRIGVRLAGTYDYDGKKISPFLLANIWQGFETKDTLHLGANAFTNKGDDTTLELGGGLSAQLNSQTNVYAKASYDMNLGGNDSHAIEGNIGLNIKW